MLVPTRTAQQAALGAVLCLGFADLALLILVLGPALQVQAGRARSQPLAAERPAARRPRVAASAPEAPSAPHPSSVGVVASVEPAPSPRPEPAVPAAPRAVPEPSSMAPALAPLPVLLFGTGGATVTSPMRIALRGVSAAMHAAGELRLLCRGHADARGTAATNLALSRRRAESVAAALVRLGVARDRLTLEALGASEPVDPTSTPAAWDRNRRVELRWR